MVQNIVDICSVAVSLLSFVLIYYIFYKNTSPEVIAYLKTGADKAKSVIYLEVKNIGNGFARDVEISFTGKVKALDYLEAKEIRFPFLQPDASIEYFIGSGYEVVKSSPIKVEIAYKFTAPIFKWSKKEKHNFILDPSSFIGIDASDNSNLATIAQTLKNIEKNIEKAVQNSCRAGQSEGRHPPY